MADRASIRSPLVTVALDDGTEHTVQTDNRDLLQYERTAARHKWPSPSAAPFGWLTFLAWHALRREGQTTLSLDDFEAHAVSVSSGDDDSEEGSTEALPTSGAADHDSWSS